MVILVRWESKKSIDFVGQMWIDRVIFGIDYRCNLSEISLLYCENFGEFGKCLIFVWFVRWESEKWVNLNCQKIYFCLNFQYFIEVTIEVNLRWFGELCENLIQFWSWRVSWTHPHPGVKTAVPENVNIPGW